MATSDPSPASLGSQSEGDAPDTPLRACSAEEIPTVLRERYACPAGERPFADASDAQVAAARVSTTLGSPRGFSYEVPCYGGPQQVFVEIVACDP